jgi:hypothetical protein
MKNLIGKLFCFITILLVTSNVVFSFSSTSTSSLSFQNKVGKTTIQKQKEIHTDDQSNVHYDFLIEEDAFENDDVEEDLEIVLDVPHSYSFHFLTPLKTSVLHINYKPLNVTIVKVPRWLLVRHIII